MGALHDYLSGTVRPGALTDSLSRLEADIDGAADLVIAWAGEQAPPEGPRADYVSLALRRILALGTLGTVPPDRLTAFVRTVATAVLFRSRADERDRLTSLLGPLARGPEAKPAPAKGLPGEREARSPSPRLTLLLDRLDVMKAAGAHARSPRELVAETVVTAALQARSPADLEDTLEDLQGRGAVRGTAEVFRTLVETLPSYWMPGSGSATPPAALIALERLCALAGSRKEGARRFGEMVEVAVEEFNRGALGRAGRVFELAERILDSGGVEAALVESLRQTGHEQLNLERVRRLVESKERSALSPAVLRFYRVFAPEAVIEKMRREPRHERRRLLLAFLETHGPEGRRAALEWLGRSEHEHDLFLLRNLVHLLRVIPRPRGSSPESEIARVARLLVPENPPYLVNEVLAFLGETPDPGAEQVAIAFLRSLEEALLSGTRDLWEEDRKRYRAYLDRTAAVLARRNAVSAWAALLDHGTRREEALGNSAARLADLASWDLGSAPALSARLLAAAQAELPSAFLADPGPAAKARLLAYVTALSGTRSPEVKELLEVLPARFGHQEPGELATRVLSAWDTGSIPRPEAAALPEASLSGDLQMFALPTLLQNLSEMRATGELDLLDDKGRRRARLTLGAGRIRGARYGRLGSPDAVFELLERPFKGTFAFRQEMSGPSSPGPSRTSPGRDVTELILEGLRRHDELRRAVLLIPDQAVLEATGQAPSAIPGESDIDFVTGLWEKAVSGATPLECEPLLAVDAYRVRRGLVHWLETGALRLRHGNGG
jgi:hypothetical protein